MTTYFRVEATRSSPPIQRKPGENLDTRARVPDRVPRIPSFGASYRRFTRGLTVDGYKSRVNIVPVNSVGSERALGFDSSESEGVVPAVCTCRYLRREIRKEKGEEGRSHIRGCACVYTHARARVCVSKRLMDAPVSVTPFKCPHFYFDPLPGFSRAPVVAYSTAYLSSIIARVKDPRFTLALVIARIRTCGSDIRFNDLERWRSRLAKTR